VLLIDQLLGDLDEDRYGNRRIDRLSIGWSEASRRRLRARSDAGVDIALALPRGGYLGDGCVLVDDGETVIAVRRPAETALVVRFAHDAGASALVAAAAQVAHALGNQHVPLDVVGGEIRAPITTSEQIALDTIGDLRLPYVTATIEPVALGCRAPLVGSSGYGHHHAPAG
jgi:urease accessory protein